MFKQPRIPEYRESEGTGKYLRSLVLFLKDFCMECWVAVRSLQKGGGLRALTSDPRETEGGDPVDVSGASRKQYPIVDENGQSCTFPTFASQVFGDGENPRALWQPGRGFYADDSQKLGGKAAEYYLQPRNLLDNSDFRNPVNQRGIPYGGSTETGYKIDRWKYETSEANQGSYFGIVAGAYVSIACSETGYVQLEQNIENYEKLKGKTCTLAVNLAGSIRTATFVMGENATGVPLVEGKLSVFSIDGYNVLIRNHSGEYGNGAWEAPMVWAALYEGTYTADNLPPYVPKGYGAELAECQRYYQAITYNGSSLPIAFGYAHNTSSLRFDIPLTVPLAASRSRLPSIGMSGEINVYQNGNAFANIGGTELISGIEYTANATKVGARITLSGITARQLCVICGAGGKITISADL